MCSSLTIGISCLDTTLGRVLENASLAALPHAKLLVIQPAQGDEVRLPSEQKALLESLGYQWVMQHQRGLSRSRNALLEHCETELLLISDDDVTFRAQDIKAASCWLESRPEIALLSGQYEKQGSLSHKGYARAPHRHTRQTRRNIASVEMLLRVGLIPDEVRFDTGFGLGALFPAGEEALFAEALARRGAALYYAPFCLASHPKLSTGDRRDEAFYVTRGALQYALDGWRGLLRLPRMLFAQRQRSGLSAWRVARAMLQGFWAARRSRR